MDPLQQSILVALLPEAEPISLPRLGKRLGQGASVLMRALTLMGPATLGGQPGPGWVAVALHDERWTVVLTDAGRQVAAHG